ncbi:hypothetical protein JCM9157_2992 [Halalkalibacter akibai JCM 9157]|uniref:Uncharacterized protein n=1 Tax=Halalkalibacter akibai (strain ATCC 43226 / DSM 21942 / CIP 109018 / JCM 9157 / 1139) TaxID=1236973 RepID=W4QUK9_HALA3|nr:hypothetical protein JCM9157_2992 [Halalkalibacter akibai JCM 9157]
MKDVRIEVLKVLQLTEESLRSRLEQEGILKIESIFLCTLNAERQLHLTYTRKNEKYQRI